MRRHRHGSWSIRRGHLSLSAWGMCRRRSVVESHRELRLCCRRGPGCQWGTWLSGPQWRRVPNTDFTVLGWNQWIRTVLSQILGARGWAVAGRRCGRLHTPLCVCVGIQANSQVSKLRCFTCDGCVVGIASTKGDTEAIDFPVYEGRRSSKS